MKYKKIILFLCIFIVTGCSNLNVEYDANIDKNGVSESINFITDATPSEIENSEYYKIPVCKYNQDEKFNPYDIYNYQDGVSYYSRLISDNNINFSQKFNLSDYYNSGMIFKFFNNFKASYNDNLLSIRSGNVDFYPNDISSIVIKYNTKYYVKLNNADSVDSDTYTWTFTKNNYKNKTINFVVDFNSNSNNFNYFYIILIVLIILLLIIFIYVFVRQKGNKNNKI